eukprot:COSAG06_NODE_8080_length_2279_cov_1.860092_1_plen_57_part_00
MFSAVVLRACLGNISHICLHASVNRIATNDWSAVSFRSMPEQQVEPSKQRDTVEKE